MDTFDNATRWSLGMWLLLGVGPVLHIAYWPQWRTDGNLAAWVQAVGSVAAILAAAGVGLHQAQQARKLEQARVDQQDLRRLLVVRALLSSVYVTVRALRNAWSASHTEANQRVISHFDPEVLQDLRKAIERLPMFDVPSAELVIFVAVLPTGIGAFCNVWKQAKEEGRNNEQLESSAEAIVRAALSDLHGQVFQACAICELEAHRLRGRHDLAALY